MKQEPKTDYTDHPEITDPTNTKTDNITVLTAVKESKYQSKMGEKYECPYKNCDWTPSRPINADNGLTQAVVTKEIRDHREVHIKNREETTETED